MVRDIVSRGKHKDGLTKWTYQVLDAEGKYLSEYLRSLTLFLNLHAIDGTAAALAERPIKKPKAKYPDGTDHLPVDQATGLPQIGIDPDIVKKLLATRYINYDSVMSNVAEQDRIIFQVVFHQSLSKQSQAQLKNSVQWAALDATQCNWDDLLNLIIEVHTIKRGGGISESHIFMRINLESKIRAYKQASGVTTGSHIEKFDDLLMEAKTIGLTIEPTVLAFLFINSTYNPASRMKRKALLTLGRPTPTTYEFAKAFVLEAEAVAASVAQFDGLQYKQSGSAALTVEAEQYESDPRQESASVTQDQRRVGAGKSLGTSPYSKKEKAQYARLSQEDKNTVNYLQSLAKKVREGDKVDIDVKTIASTVSTLTSATKSGRVCYICGVAMDSPGGHPMRKCKVDPKVAGYPYAPEGFRPRDSGRVKQVGKGPNPEQKKQQPVQQTASVLSLKGDKGDSDDEDFLYLDTILCMDVVQRPRRTGSVQRVDESRAEEMPDLLEVSDSEENDDTPDLVGDSDSEDEGVQRDEVGWVCGDGPASDGRVSASPRGPHTTDAGHVGGCEATGACDDESQKRSGPAEVEGRELARAHEATASGALTRHHLPRLQSQHVALVMEGDESAMTTNSSLKRKLESNLEVLDAIASVPTDAEISFQVDIMNMPSLAESVASRAGLRLIRLPSGVQVVERGPFDTTRGRPCIMKFNTSAGITKQALEQQRDIAVMGKNQHGILNDKGEQERRVLTFDEEEEFNFGDEGGIYSAEDPDAMVVVGPGQRVLELGKRIDNIIQHCEAFKRATVHVSNAYEAKCEKDESERHELGNRIINLMNDRGHAFDQLHRAQKEIEELKYSINERNLKDSLEGKLTLEQKATGVGESEIGRLQAAEKEAEEFKSRYQKQYWEGEKLKLELVHAKDAVELRDVELKSERKQISIMREELRLQQRRYEDRIDGMLTRQQELVNEAEVERDANEYLQKQNNELTHRIGKMDRLLDRQRHQLELSRQKEDTTEKTEVEGTRAEGDNLNDVQEGASEVGEPREEKALVTDDSTSGQPNNAKKPKKVLTKAERELAKIKTNIDVDNFTHMRKQRQHEEEEQSKEREIDNLRDYVLWNCEKSTMARNEYKRMFLKSEAHEREREFNKKWMCNGGRQAYIDFLNQKVFCAADRFKPPITLNWIDQEVDRMMSIGASNKGHALVTHVPEEVKTELENASTITIRDKNVVCLDNAATIHVFRDETVLHSLKPILNGGVLVGGLNKEAKGVHCENKGMFLSVSGVHHGPSAIANLLSFAKLKDQGHTIGYDEQRDEFDLRLRGTKIQLTFRRSLGIDGMHYVCQINPEEYRDQTAAIMSVKEKESQFTKLEVKEAAKARQQTSVFNFMSEAAHRDIIANKYIDNNPVTLDALKRSVEIWGKPVERLKGNSKYRKPEAASLRLGKETNISEPRINMAHADLFFVQGLCFIIIVLDPMKYCWIKYLAGRTTEHLKQALEGFFSEMISKMVKISVLRCDGEAGIWALESWIREKAVMMDRAAPGAHCEIAERKIEQGKEGTRRACAALPYLLCKSLLIACVLYAFRCINLQRTKGQIERNEPPPQVQLDRKNLDAQLHFPHPFGTYVEATVRETDNTNHERSESAIYCGSTYQSTENNSIYIIRTRRMAERGNVTALPISQGMIDILNRQAARDFGESVSKNPDFATREYAEVRANELGEDTEIGVLNAREVMPEDNVRVTRSMTESNGGIEGFQISQEARRIRVAHGSNDMSENVEIYNTPPRTETHEFDSAEMWQRHGRAISPRYWGSEWQDLQTESIANGGEQSQPEPSTPSSNRMERIPDEVFKTPEIRVTEQRALVMSQKQAIKKLGSNVALPAINKELRQMVDKKVWRPVHWNSLTEQQRKKMIPSIMFLKEKYLPTGEFDKLKARFVAGGHKQDRMEYDDVSSPTARLSSVFAVIAIAAHEKRVVETGDIPGAYLNADMTTEVIMELDQVTSAEMCKIDKKYIEYKNEKGRIAVQLLKALYGCIDSAKLWNEDISRILVQNGFVPNPHDNCVFNKGFPKEKNQITVVVYVDDLLVTCTDLKRIQELWKIIRAAYARPPLPDICVKTGPILHYLGMTMDFTESGEVAVTQVGYTKDMLKDSQVDCDKKATSPAADSLFDVREDSEAGEATAAQQEWFHSHVAKCLYLAKRTRPEILTTTAFLATRVTKCNKDDIKKLARMLYYLSGSVDRGIIFKLGERGVQIRQFIDASYGVHVDMKSCSGGVTVLGDAGPNMTNSCKQSIVTKSSTEAELVAASDLMNQPFHMKELLTAQGYEVGPIILYQDNLNCMHIMAKGKAGSQRTRHIAIRYYWIKQHMDDKTVIVEKVPTEQMPANILTKPLQGSQFRYERQLLTNWKD